MKIKKLVLQNINSLYGKWEIDFDCEKFRQSGIFAVTGKTGSGKSSILDAMCLALYGTTPRLNKDTAEAVSRGCKECMCELTFLDTNNQEWIATFAYEMITRGENKGRMKSDALHRLACNGKTVAEKTTKVRHMVEEIIGLDSERFCRAVLLAQGSFDAFLNAGRDNGEILERITGTGIYSSIADKLKERYTEEKNKLSTIEAQFDGITIMSDEEAQQVQQKKAALDAEISTLTTAQEALNKLMEKFQQLELHTKNLEKCSEDEKKLAAENLAFAPDRQRFEAGKKVLDADEKYRPLKDLLKQKAETEMALQKNEQLLQEQKKQYAEKEKNRETASAAVEQYEKEFETLSATLTAVNQLDTIIKNLSESCAAGEEKRRAEVLRTLQCRTALAESNSKLAELKKTYSEATAYLASHPDDDQLVSIQKSCSEWLINYKASLQKSAKTAKLIAACRKELESLQMAIAEKGALLQAENGNHEKITRNAEKKKQEITALLDGATKEHWQTLAETQEKCYRQALLFHSLEEHRKQLKDGVECPLCGAKEHPFASGNIPEPEKEYAALEQLKKRLAAIDKAEKELQKINVLLNACENSRLQLQSEMEQLKIKSEAKTKEIDTHIQTDLESKNDSSQAEQKIDNALVPFALSWNKKTGSLPEELGERIKAYDICKASRLIYEEDEKKCRDEILRLRTNLKMHLENCRSCKTEWKKVKGQLADQLVERQDLFGSKDPAAEAQIAQKKRKALAAKLEKANIEFTTISTSSSRTGDDIQKQKNTIEALLPQISNAQKDFLDACSIAGVSEDEFHTSVLSKDEMRSLAAKDAELNTLQKQFAETRQKCENVLKELSAFLTTQKSRQEITEEREKISGELQEKNQAVGALREKIRQDVAAKQKMAEQRTKLLEQKKTMELWTRLYELIGVKDKFQRFAQGITLEHLLVLANLELEKLSGRYRLLRSKDEELGIDVADKDQGDEIRNCKTLSGGERFLVSLALALGLSQMAGEKIRVDSLFLDEGFGTLDAETLETALEALSNLRNRGKLVGVISHVAAFSEKIPCIIEVNKSGGGRSTLQGPGVRSL